MHLLPAGQRAVSPFFASLPFCVHPSHNLGKKKERKKENASRKERRSEEKNCGGGGRCASIFAFKGTVACHLCSPAFENLSTRNHECLLAIAAKCVLPWQLRSTYNMHDSVITQSFCNWLTRGSVKGTVWKIGEKIFDKLHQQWQKT